MEQINVVKVLDSGELLLKVESGGKPSYSYVYRAARGVYWEGALGGFRSQDRSEWSLAKWFTHIKGVCRDELGVELRLGKDVEWVNIPDADKRAILIAHQR